MIRNFAALGAIFTCVACGDDIIPTCPVSSLGTQFPYCASAANLALRHVDQLVLRQQDMDTYYEIQRPAWLELPTLRMVMAEYDDVGTPTAIRIQSKSTAILASWSNGTLQVGDSVVDQLFAEAGAISVTRLPVDSPDGYGNFLVEFELPVSWRVLDTRLSQIPDTRLDPDHYQPPLPPDIVLVWNGTDADLTFTLGWGDCMVQCIGTHAWLATVHADGSLEIEDLGGDEVPADIEASAAQRPPPI